MLVRSGSVDDWPGRELLESLAGPVAVECPVCGSRLHGRPSVARGFASMARAGGMVVAVVADAPVGIDIEPVASGDERVRAIAALTGEWSIEHWTRVEAVLKADGRGLSLDPSRVHVSESIAELDGVRYALELHPVDPAFIVTTAALLPGR